MFDVKISGVPVVSGDDHVVLLSVLEAGDHGGVEVVHLAAPEHTDPPTHLQLRLGLDSHIVDGSLQEILSGEDVRFVAPGFVHDDAVDVRRNYTGHPPGVEEALQSQQNLSFV